MRRALAAVVRFFKVNLGAGLLVFVPLALTVWLVRVVWNWLDRPVRMLVRQPAEDAQGTVASVARALNRATGGAIAQLDRPGIGLLLLFGGLLLLGFLTRSFIGRRLVRLGEAIIGRLPLVHTIYGGTKQILEPILTGGGDQFRHAVIFEYPRKGIYAVGFVTSHSRGEVQEHTRGDTVNVFLPTTPNPTSGFLLMLPKKDVIPLEMSVEDAVKLVISGGIVSPEKEAVEARNPDGAAQPPAPAAEGGTDAGDGQRT